MRYLFDGKEYNYNRLNKDIVFAVRNMYYADKKKKSDIEKELNISAFSIYFAINENFLTFSNKCEGRKCDMNLSLDFMEQLYLLNYKSSRDYKLKPAIKFICKELGIVYSDSIYIKGYSYSSGRTTYCMIPENVQRLVD